VATKTKSVRRADASEEDDPHALALREQEASEREERERSAEIEREQDEAEPRAPSVQLEPPVPPDNPKNPKGISSNLTDGSPDAQATDAQKVQNPTPARPPLAATATTSVLERVSAGQNRKPPQEIIP
jgi:hypothetical protein